MLGVIGKQCHTRQSPRILWVLRFRTSHALSAQTFSECGCVNLSQRIQLSGGKNRLITIEAIPQPTEAEIAEQKANAARAQRDRLLLQTDYLVSGDYPISDSDLAAVKSYRQALRDVPEQEGFPDSVVWPELPQVTVIRD